MRAHARIIADEAAHMWDKISATYRLYAEMEQLEPKERDLWRDIESGRRGVTAVEDVLEFVEMLKLKRVAEKSRHKFPWTLLRPPIFLMRGA